MNVCGFTQDRPSAGAAQIVTVAGRARPSSGLRATRVGGLR